MERKFIILLILLPFWLGPALGQTLDSLTNQPAETLQDTILEGQGGASATLPDTSGAMPKNRNFIGRLLSKEDYPNPNKALYLSLAFPGAGQMYNKRWWKLPFVYGGYVGLALAVDFNTSRYKLYRDAYIAELAGEEHPLSHTNLDEGDLRRIRDGYDKNRQLSYIGFFALHIIQTAEAFVDCHLKTFDVSDDLSFRVSPKVGATSDGGSYLGVGLTFQLSD